MFVHCIENREDPETEDMYDATIYYGNDMEKCQMVEDDAHNNIQSEDKFSTENQDKINQNSNAVDLELIEKYKCAHFWDIDYKLST